jgi:hypothetical protein
MGGWGSGPRRKPGHRLVESCPVLDANHMLAMGWLQPGWAGTCPLANGNAIDLRVTARQLCFSWRFAGDGQASEGPGEGQTIDATSSGEEGGDATSSGGKASEGEGGGTIIPIVIPIVYGPCPLGGTRPYFLCPGAGCGRRVFKLYFVRRHFLCRQCGQLVYASKYEQPWRQASRHAAKLRQRLGETAGGVPGKPEDMPVPVYAQLLEAMLEAEIRATEAGTARLQQLAAWVESRRKRLFTLD